MFIGGFNIAKRMPQQKQHYSKQTVLKIRVADNQKYIHSSTTFAPIQNSQIRLKNTSQKSNSSVVLSSENKKLSVKIKQYIQREHEQQQQINLLYRKIDSLENACKIKDDVNSNLELYAVEFESMNIRYGNLPFSIEKKISNYLAKK